MATPTTISKQNRAAASKPMTHKTNLTGHAHAVDAGALLLGLGGVSGAVSCWGIGLGVVRPADYRMPRIIKILRACTASIQ